MGARHPWAIAGLVLTALALSTATAQAGPTESPTSSHPALHSCRLGPKRPFRCGHIVVPLRRADPGLGTTRIAFAVRPHTDRKQPSLGTIFAVDGGPGYASTAPPFARSIVAALGPQLRRRDLVLVDERGTGGSGAINCAAVQGGLIQEGIAVAECAAQLGPRFAAYTTAEAAADLDAVRRSLGLGKIILYGDSYGTLWGQAYAARFESSLAGLILDSSYPGTGDPFYRSIYPTSLRGLRITCRRSPDCSGDPVARFSRVVARFHAARRSTEGLLAFLLQAGNLAPRSYLGLDDADRRFLAGEPRRLNRLIAPGRLGEGSFREFSAGLEIAVECNDYPLLWDPRAPVDRRIAELSASVRALPRDYFAPFGRREYILSPATRLTSCLTWPAPPPGGLEPPVPAGWRASTSFPTLIVAGQVDNVTSPREGRTVAARFPRSRFYLTPDRGHASSLFFPFRSPAVGVIRHFIAGH